jgi:hypothetical protein
MARREEEVLYEEVLLDELRSSLVPDAPGSENRGAWGNQGRRVQRPSSPPPQARAGAAGSQRPSRASCAAAAGRPGRRVRPRPALPPPHPAGAVYVAPDSSKVAVLHATGSHVSLYGQKSGFARRAVTFTPPSPAGAAPAAAPPASAYEGSFFEEDGAAGAGELARHAVAEAQPGDAVLSCSWSPDSKLLLVLCASSAAYIIDGCGGGAAAAAAATAGCWRWRRWRHCRCGCSCPGPRRPSDPRPACPSAAAASCRAS